VVVAYILLIESTVLAKTDSGNLLGEYLAGSIGSKNSSTSGSGSSRHGIKIMLS